MVRVDIQDGLWENTPDKVKTPGIVNAGAIHKITYSRQSCMLRHKFKQARSWVVFRGVRFLVFSVDTKRVHGGHKLS